MNECLLNCKLIQLLFGAVYYLDQSFLNQVCLSLIQSDLRMALFNHGYSQATDNLTIRPSLLLKTAGSFRRFLEVFVFYMVLFLAPSRTLLYCDNFYSITFQTISWQQFCFLSSISAFVLQINVAAVLFSPFVQLFFRHTVVIRRLILIFLVCLLCIKTSIFFEYLNVKRKLNKREITMRYYKTIFIANKIMYKKHKTGHIILYRIGQH